METKTKSSSMARLTEDLIVEILSRLPVKSLMRFKCVSKRWCSLISDTHFAKVQLRRAAEGNSTSSQRIIKNSSLQTFDYEALDNGEDYGVAVQLHTPGKDLEDSFGLVGHCDGLVCLACKGGGYMLYNPTTRQSRKLPNSGLVMQDDVFHGFGYDPTTDDYKILQGAFVSSHEAVMKIFALKSNYWKRIPNSHVTGAYKQGIYLNGALHWLVRHKIGSGKWVCSIVSFDLAEEKLKEVLKLPDVSPDIKLEGLGVHGARLFTYAGTWCDRFKAWIMHEYGEKESWAELFDVSMDGIVFPSDYWSKPLCYTKSGKIVFNVDGQKMLLFNSEESTLKPFPTQDADWESMIYLESLLSPYVGYFTRESRRDEGWQRVCIHIGNTFVWI